MPKKSYLFILFITCNIALNGLLLAAGNQAVYDREDIDNSVVYDKDVNQTEDTSDIDRGVVYDRDIDNSLEDKRDIDKSVVYDKDVDESDNYMDAIKD